MFSVKGSPIPHSYPINYSAVRKHLCDSDTLIADGRGAGASTSLTFFTPANESPTSAPCVSSGVHSVCLLQIGTGVHYWSGDGCNLWQFAGDSPMCEHCCNAEPTLPTLPGPATLFDAPLLSSPCLPAHGPITSQLRHHVLASAGEKLFK